MAMFHSYIRLPEGNPQKKNDGNFQEYEDYIIGHIATICIGTYKVVSPQLCLLIINPLAIVILYLP